MRWDGKLTEDAVGWLSISTGTASLLVISEEQH